MFKKTLSLMIGLLMLASTTLIICPTVSNGSTPEATYQSRLNLPAFIPKDIPFTQDAVLYKTEDKSYASAGQQDMTITYKSKLPFNDVVKKYKNFASSSTKGYSENKTGNQYSSNSRFEKYELQINIEPGQVKLFIRPEYGTFPNHKDKTDYSDGVTDKSGITDPNLQVPRRLVAASSLINYPYLTNLFVRKNNSNLYGRGANLYTGVKKNQDDQWDRESVDGKWTLIDDNAYCLDTEGDNYYLLKPDGGLWTYGTNYDYLLGNGEAIKNDNYPPSKILDDVRSADIGRNGTAVKKDGSLWIWGTPSELFSVLDNPEEFRKQPEKVMDDVVDAEQSGSVKGSNDAIIMVLKTDGSLWTWGRGNCGDGGVTREREKPIKVMNGVKAIEASDSLCCVIKKDNSLWIWESHIGGSEINYSISFKKPIKILTDVKMVSPGTKFLSALKTDGSVWTFGENVHGQCGIGSTKTKFLSTPRKILDGVSEIAASDYNAFALLNNGKILGWGLNQQLPGRFDWLKIKEGHVVLKPTDIGFGVN